MNFRYRSSERLKDVRGILTTRKEAPTPDPIFKSIDRLSIKLVFKIRTLSKQEDKQEHLLQKVPELFQFHWNSSITESGRTPIKTSNRILRMQTSGADYVSYDIEEEALCYFVKTPVMRWRGGCWRGWRWTEGSSCPLDLLLLVCLVTTQSVGRGRRLMQGRKGAPWRSWVPRRAKKVEPRCLGSPP